VLAYSRHRCQVCSLKRVSSHNITFTDMSYVNISVHCLRHW